MPTVTSKPKSRKNTKNAKPINIICSCSGTGLWSNDIRTTTTSKVCIGTQPITQLEDGSITQTFEIQAYFSKKDWNINKHGLIYTDDGWIRDFRNGFGKAIGHSFKGLDYTEQGMQGDNYVSLEIVCTGERTIKKFFAAVRDKEGIEFSGYPDEFC